MRAAALSRRVGGVGHTGAMTGQPARIDLHTHSTASDGSESPTELVAAAVAAGLDVLAVTDHDTTGGWDEAAAARPEGLTLVRGMELSCTSAGGLTVHLLGYLVDPDAAPLAHERTRLQGERRTRLRAMAERRRRPCARSAARSAGCSSTGSMACNSLLCTA